ncbi:MAG: DUF4837 family protein [Bacteroidaceae bacterium]|nr:DUF4837 family protein [Bacteroidaceae bacterium]
MKKLTTLLLIAILCSCSSDSPTLFKPASSGLPYEVLVVCDDAFWEAPAGRALFDVLDTDVPALPQSERSFRISHTRPEGFKRLLKTFRNIIVVNIDKNLYTQTKFKFTRDEYATPQVIMTIQSPNEQDFKEYVSKHTQTIIDFFNSNEMNRELKNVQKRHNEQFLDSVKSKFDCEMFIPDNILGLKSGKDFLWASDIANNNSSIMNFVVYSYPYTSVENFTLENYLHMRDSIMKANIPGGKEGQYMTTEHDYVEMKETMFKEKYMQEVRGLWSMHNDMMGGPFVSHSMVDELNNKVIVVEAFLFAPSRKKGDLMRKLEASLFSLRLPADKAIANSIHIPELVVEESDTTIIEK